MPAKNNTCCFYNERRKVIYFCRKAKRPVSILLCTLTGHETFISSLIFMGNQLSHKIQGAICRKTPASDLCLPVPRGGGPSRVRQPKCTTATPKRCNVRTRPSLTAFNQRRSACCSGMYSPLCLPAPYTNRGLSFAYSKTVTRSRPCI